MENTILTFNGKVAGKISAIIGTGLIVQFIVRYFGQEYVSFDGFHTVIFFSRLLIPILVAYFLGLSLSDLGLSMPTGGKKWVGGFLFLLGLITVAVFWGISLESTYKFYLVKYGALRNAQVAFVKLSLLFTFSTTLPWEFFHRGFLLFGLQKSLSEALPSEDSGFVLSGFLAMMFLWVFEVIFHFSKPAPEAFGMAIVSIALSYVALISRSILYPLLLHVYIELVFLVAVVMIVLK
ncbi:MAG: hypothetical protein HQM08_20115 [Candidatus Riflebacteria bacterium]|nr:hypothetical protein [Candidatus Riflebacteria bacterium]